MPTRSRVKGKSAESLAATLAQLRSRSGYTQAEVAERMDTTQTAIARLESGKQSPTIQTLQNYARANGYCLEIGFIGSSGEGGATGCVLFIEETAPTNEQISGTSDRKPVAVI